jgi:Ca2+-binding EF-hand superfamily protein
VKEENLNWIEIVIELFVHLDPKGDGRVVVADLFDVLSQGEEGITKEEVKFVSNSDSFVVSTIGEKAI